MRVEPRKHLVSAIAVRYHRTAAPTNDVTQSYPQRDITTTALPDIREKLYLQISGSE